MSHDLTEVFYSAADTNLPKGAWLIIALQDNALWAHTRQITLHGALTVCLSSTYVIYAKYNSQWKHTAPEN